MKKHLARLLALALTAALALTPAAALELEGAKALLAEYYLEEIPPEVLALDDLEALLDALGDPYTFYMDWEQIHQHDQSVDGPVRVGVGITVQSAYDGGYRITAVAPGGPAGEAGVLPGDLLTAVDGVPLSPEVDPVSLVPGEEGTTTTLTVLRAGKKLQFHVTRRTIILPIVTYALRGDAAYIDCDSFGASTAPVMEQALTELGEAASLFLVDLRDNSGGTDAACAQSAGLFIGGGPVLYFRDRDGGYRRQSLPASYPDLTDKPAILLTNENSASAAELFAGIIRDYGAGISLGQRTYGKGVAQRIFDAQSHPGLFQEGEALRVTTSRFFSPAGTSNHIVGVLPTLVLSPGHTEQAALLLSCPLSDFPENHLRLELAGQVFCVNLDEALREENRPDLTELLEALPPSAVVQHSTGQDWTECPPVSPAALAEELGLEGFSPRAYPGAEDSPYRRELDTLAAYRLLPNLGEEFLPRQEMTRAEFATLLTVALNPYYGPGGQFLDVPEGYYYAGPIHAVTGLGLLSGYGDGSFRPEAPLAYEQLVCTLANLAAWANMDAYDLAAAGPEEAALEQYTPFPAWARPSAWLLGELNLLLPGLEPGQAVTREEASALTCRLLERIGLIWG